MSTKTACMEAKKKKQPWLFIPPPSNGGNTLAELMRLISRMWGRPWRKQKYKKKNQVLIVLYYYGYITSEDYQLSIQTTYTYTGIASEGQALVSKVNLCYINKEMRKIKLKRLFITEIK